ncbi:MULTISPECIES: NAD kinase [Chryseobacterium]|jgi:NAD+ kinase|uniref:NAD kinase n=1 Tax=Chryseobacterium nepalense TaxID=1854498 RepID=A0ABY4K171_9FLAO|nr:MULTISPECIES: NAD kinase [Chryseobacterium]MEA1850045.1 NAD kinase [Chryseobacterium sp. MHB01]MEC5172916.1 NAD+ kinase [Chryseobacterium nepalense]UPQ74552.1 NAD kinase [Chryseobacterium nepalense]
MKAAIYSQKKDLDTFLYLSKFISELENRGVKSVLYDEMAEALQFSKIFETFNCKQDLLDKEVDLFFTFGGDGTIVNSLTFIEDLEIPIVGVNTGRLGFLASFTKEEAFNALDSILKGDVKTSRRSVIEVTSPEIEDFFPYALNDVTVSRKETTSMITVDSYINNEFLNVFWGDGVIVSTPTGSTAYSLSSGGPIISPNNENFVITPIAPHNLNVRPLVVNDKVEIKFKVESRVPQYSLSLDSRLIHIETDKEIIIKKADFQILLVQPNNLSFYETIRQKLLWGRDKRN